MKITMEHVATLANIAAMGAEMADEDSELAVDAARFRRAAAALEELLKPDMIETTEHVLAMFGDSEGG